MFRGPLLQPKPQEAPHPKRVRCTPRHPTLGVQALEVPHQQEPKVASRGQARTPQNRRIEPAASRFHESVEALGLQPLYSNANRKDAQGSAADRSSAPTNAS